MTVTVNPIPEATATPASQTICSGETTLIELESNVVNTTFAWTVSQTGVTGASAGSAETISQALTATGNNTGTVVYSVIPSANGCNGVPIIVTITVNPGPVATANPSTQTICSGSTTDIDLTSNVTGTIFEWTVTQTGVTGASQGTGANISQELTASGITPGSVIYNITPTAEGCEGNPIQVTVTVNPTPNVTANPSSQAICSGGTASISLSGDVAGTTYSWTVVQSGVSGATGGSGAVINQTLTATGNNQGSATYTITPTANGCPGPTTEATITLYPSPVGETLLQSARLFAMVT